MRGKVSWLAGFFESIRNEGYGQMKKLWIASAVLLALVFCADESPSGAGSTGTEPKKLLVVASLFPQYDFARQIAGDLAEVVMLLPPGAESHSFDPRPGDILTLNRADLFAYTGEVMEPWAKRVLDGLNNKNLLVVDASKGIALRRTEEEESDHDHSHDEEYDPHIWLDPVNAIKMVDTIAGGLCEKDPANAEVYRANAAKYAAKIKRLDDSCMEIFEAVKQRGDDHTLVFGGPFAYFYFLDHYKLKYVTAYDSCSAENEPGVRRIAEVLRYIKENNVRYVFYDPMENAKVARSIADETGAELLPFRTAHNVAKDKFESGYTYLGIMMNNLLNVESALGIVHLRPPRIVPF